MQEIHGNSSEMERYKRQQLILEQKLSHVRSILASNSKVVSVILLRWLHMRCNQKLIRIRERLQIVKQQVHYSFKIENWLFQIS